MTTFKVVPSKTALLVVDLQHMFVSDYPPISAPDGKLILERLNKLANVCRDNGIQVIYTAHILRDDVSNIGVLGKIIPFLEKERMLNEDNPASALHPDVKMQEGDIYLKKPRFGSFSGTDLDLILRNKGIDTVIIGGIATNICCETTAREANHLDYQVIFLTDGTTTGGYADQGFGELTPEEVQKATCSVIGYCFGEIAAVDDVIGRIVEASKGKIRPDGNPGHIPG